MKKYLFLLAFFASILLAQEVKNGKTLILAFPSSQEGYILWGEKQFPLVAHPKDEELKIAFIPIDYKSKKGHTTLLHVDGFKQTPLALSIVDGNYAQETLHVESSKAQPSAEQKAKVAQEYQEAMAIYGTITPKRYWSEPFEKPINSHITSVFGNARVFNGTLKSFHSGVDFRAYIGTPIVAVNDGVVVLAKERFYAGNSVIIDHGEGIYSCYYHLSKIDVKVGEKIQKNQKIGLSGDTGRVSGPHLHFAMMVLGVQIDPLDFLTQINTLF
ncbi:MAG: M23 family metallopeptidase [Sulfurospirillaceae bacterium]|nr:M23 family metallopeptidase [Sulfurospirillaceae bacterium]MDD3462973.1 M23 family metallopeptidase [Sulfurospirillaceae bacterium]